MCVSLYPSEGNMKSWDCFSAVSFFFWKLSSWWRCRKTLPPSALQPCRSWTVSIKAQLQPSDLQRCCLDRSKQANTLFPNVIHLISQYLAAIPAQQQLMWHQGRSWLGVSGVEQSAVTELSPAAPGPEGWRPQSADSLVACFLQSYIKLCLFRCFLPVSWGTFIGQMLYKQEVFHLWSL